MGLHKNIPFACNHVAHSLEYANTAARTGASGLVAADVGRIARQTDDDTFWVLTDHAPVTWLQIGAGSASGLPTDFFEGSSDAASSTSLDTPQSKLLLNPTLEGGDYIVFYSAELKHSLAGSFVRVQMEFDATDEAFADIAPVSGGTEEMSWSGFVVLTGVSAAAHTFEILWECEPLGGTATIRRARIAGWKVGT